MTPLEFAQALKPLVDMYRLNRKGHGLNVPTWPKIADYAVVGMQQVAVAATGMHWHMHLQNMKTQVVIVIKPMVLEITPANSDKTFRFDTAKSRYAEIRDIEVR